MTPADRALARLLDPAQPQLQQLARLVVEEAASTPIRDIAEPRWIASQIATALQALTRGPAARDWLAARMEEGVDRAKQHSAELGTWMPREVDTPLRQLLRQPYTPDEALVYRLIDQPATHALVREVLEGTLTRFARKLRSLEGSSLGKLRAAASKTGKGLFGRVKSSQGLQGGLGGLAENLVGSVAEEFEAQLEHRVREFVGRATGEAIRTIAAHLANPELASAHAELRVGVLDALLSTPLSQLGAEATKLEPEELLDVILAALRGEAQQEAFIDRTAERVEAVLAEAGEGTLGAWLDEVGLRDMWVDSSATLVHDRLRAVVRTASFEAWWERLHAE